MTNQQPVKKVALLLHDLDEGGMQTVCLKLVRALEEHPNVELELVLSSGTGRLLQQLPRTVKIVDLQIPFALCLSYLWQATVALAGYFRRSQPDSILSNLPFVNVITPLAKLLALSPVSVLLVEHTLPLRRSLQTENSRPLSSKFTAVVEVLSHGFYPRVDAIVTPSQGLGQEVVRAVGLQGNGLERLEVIYNPVVDQLLYQKSRAVVRHPWFAPGQPPVILAVGRLTRQKNFATLLRSFAQLRQGRLVRLIILGDGPQRVDLENLVSTLGLKDDVLLPGFVENPYAYMSRAAVFVLSSVWETFGLVLAEALACGCPVVSTDCEHGPAEVLDHGKYGLLVPVRDVAALAQALDAVLTQGRPGPELLQERSRLFSLDQAARQYCQLLGVPPMQPINHGLPSPNVLNSPRQ